MYGEFSDSSGLLGAGRERLLEALRSDGYLFFRGLLDPDRVRQVRAQVVRILIEHKWAVETPVGALRATCKPYHPGDPEYWPVYTAVQSIESLHELAYEPELLAVMRSLLGDDLIVHPRKMARIAFPEAQDPVSTTPAHQDFPYVQGGVDCLTAWVSLGDTPRDLGGLAVLTGSARLGILPISGGDYYRCAACVLDQGASGEWLSTDYRAGDVLIFHSLTVHSAIPNQTENLRISADFRYRPATEPIAEDQLVPPYHPNVPDWSVLSQGWRSLEWITPPAGIEVRPSVDPSAGVPVPASCLIGTSAATLTVNGVSEGEG